MQVSCSVEYTELDSGRNGTVAGVIVTCTRCGKETESFGQSESSIKHCFATLREDCEEDNFYYYED